MKKDEFLKVVDDCINLENIKFLAISVDGVGPVEELIINPKENFQSKRDYYDKTYDENMVHRYSPTIKITYVGGWGDIRFSEGLVDENG